jgi:hypothetical protein
MNQTPTGFDESNPYINSIKIWITVNPFAYSYLKETIGSRLAAFRAGKIPKQRPTEIETNNPKITDQDVTEVGRGVAALTRKEIANPIITPKVPPVPVRKIASIRNCFRISAERAPMAFRIPISLVLSLTATSMIFMTPIPPTSRPMEEMTIMTM